MSNFKNMKYGMFIHYTASAARKPDGSIITDANESAECFNVESFANDLASFGVEYIIFTIWHYNMVCFYPSKLMEKWLQGHTVERDLAREIISALKSKGIGTIFYTHPRDGHDFSEADSIATGWGSDRKEYKPHPNPSTFDFVKWNDFLNDIYGELVDRYGSDLLGIYLDEGSEQGDSEWVVDYPRLRDTIKSRNPKLYILQNYFGNIYTCDMGDKEYCHSEEFAFNIDENWPCHAMPVAPVFTKHWSAYKRQDYNSVYFSPESMFRYTVLQAGANTDGGGVQWATGPFAGGGWDTGVVETMQALNNYIFPISMSIKQTYPSTSYITSPDSTIVCLQWGVATKSIDEKYEYIHVLNKPFSDTLILPAPADGKLFATAILLSNGNEVELVQTENSVSLKLLGNDKWDSYDTAIQLNVAKA